MGLLRYFHISLSGSSGNAIMALTCCGLRLTASGSQDADLGGTGAVLHLPNNNFVYVTSFVVDGCIGITNR